VRAPEHGHEAQYLVVRARRPRSREVRLRPPVVSPRHLGVLPRQRERAGQGRVVVAEAAGPGALGGRRREDYYG
jgi:hypothetical protein